MHQAALSLAISIVVAGGCSSPPDGERAVAAHRDRPAAILLHAADIEAYHSGVTREINLRTEAQRLGLETREEQVDSAVARAAGLPVARYLAVVHAIHDLLARGSENQPDDDRRLAPDAESLWNQQRILLDSLRLEALVLRARSGS